MRMLAGGSLALVLACVGFGARIGYAQDTGSVTGHVRLTTRVRGTALPSNAYQPRAVTRRDTPAVPEMQNAVVYLKDVTYIELGGGITPTIGLRFGLSPARGNYATGEELTVPADEGRELTLIGFEGEYAFNYTKISGELIRDRLETTVGTETVVGSRTKYHSTEATVGFRLSPDFTLRSSFLSRKAYTRTEWDQQAGISVVWAHRWW